VTLIVAQVVLSSSVSVLVSEVVELVELSDIVTTLVNVLVDHTVVVTSDSDVSTVLAAETKRAIPASAVHRRTDFIDMIAQIIIRIWEHAIGLSRDR